MLPPRPCPDLGSGIPPSRGGGGGATTKGRKSRVGGGGERGDTTREEEEEEEEEEEKGLMGSKPWLIPAPTYRPVETGWDTDDDAPGPRCGHTLTVVAATKTHGPLLILFGGATAIEGGPSSSVPGIRLAGVTNSVHSYCILTRKWTRHVFLSVCPTMLCTLISSFSCRKLNLWFNQLHPAGEPPSPRAAHAAAAVGTMVVFQGGIGPAGHSTDDLFVLDMTNDRCKWHRVVVQGAGPGPRYGHTMDLVAQRFLVTVSGNDGVRIIFNWKLLLMLIL
ncbi:hypothetical protein Taro_028347 [Colocasia esculenta]|uniref:Uncharacterized protein n=1 Tax=Colocasia esculenta TaxID=4460 RepID=A0A843VMV9_COLES|nr:hypothetical protein [Colocasia esculenta]